jgi:site-specific DNA recombinase
MERAVREGRWTNRPKFGYDLHDGVLVPNGDAGTVRRIFALRSQGRSYREIEEATGVKFSSVKSILDSRIYLGEVQLRGEWFPGRHEPLVSVEEWQRAHRGHVPGRRRSKQLLAGRVRCGLCGRLAAVEYSQTGVPKFRCMHRGRGCKQPRKRAEGLERAAVLGLRLLRDDDELRDAIRAEVAGAQGSRPAGASRDGSTAALADLQERRRKLLDLYYAERIGADLYAEEEERLRRQIEVLRAEQAEHVAEVERRDEVSIRFEEVAALLEDLDIDRIWAAANEQERRVLIEELVESVDFFPDHLQVTVAGAPPLNVLLEEVGLQQGVQTVGVGERT